MYGRICSQMEVLLPFELSGSMNHILCCNFHLGCVLDQPMLHPWISGKLTWMALVFEVKVWKLNNAKNEMN